MNKTELRKVMTDVRNNITQVRGKSRQITSVLTDFLDKNRFVKIFSYVSMAGEVDTFELLEYYSKKRDCEVYIPRTKFSQMELVRADRLPLLLPDKLGNAPGYEAAAAYDGRVDVVIVPMLAFNKDKYRLGYGGGYYDKFLEGRRDVLSVGIAFDEQFCPDFKQDSWDVPLDIIITPTRFL